jgi:RNA polymerase sigma factor (sigma-70 family)
VRELSEADITLAHRIAKFRCRRAPAFYEDTISAAYEGLVKAAHDYDPEQGRKWRSYASMRIHHSITDWRRHERNRTVSGLQRNPDYDHISHAEFSEEHSTTGDEEQYEAVERAEQLSLIYQAISKFNSRDTRICILYYRHNLTMKQIADEMGLSVGRISQILQACEKDIIKDVRGSI